MAQANPTDVEATKYAESFILYGDKTRAFRAAFPDSKAAKESQNVKAVDLHNTVKVQLRIEELRENINSSAIEGAGFTLEQAFTEFEEARQVAKEEGQAAAMNGSTTGKAKLAGLWVDKISADVKADVRVRKLDDFYSDNE